jgi:flagellin-like hook-associated protein FlgL
MNKKEKKKSIYDSIKEKLENTGGNGNKIFFTSAGDKKKIRFLTDFEDALVIHFHSSKYGAENRFCHPCLSYYGKKCPSCGNKEATHDNYYAWSVYDYKSQDVKLFIYKANKCSPIPSLMALHEEYGTIIDRDYTIKQTGEGTSKSFDFLGGDKKRFKIEVDIPTEEEIYSILKGDKYMYNLGEIEEPQDEEEEEEEVKPTSKKPVKGKTVVSKKIVAQEDEDEEEEDEEDEEDEEEDELPFEKTNVKKVATAKKPVKKKVEEDDEDDF